MKLIEEKKEKVRLAQDNLKKTKERIEKLRKEKKDFAISEQKLDSKASIN